VSKMVDENSYDCIVSLLSFGMFFLLIFNSQHAVQMKLHKRGKSSITWPADNLAEGVSVDELWEVVNFE